MKFLILIQVFCVIVFACLIALSIALPASDDLETAEQYGYGGYGGRGGWGGGYGRGGGWGGGYGRGGGWGNRGY